MITAEEALARLAIAVVLGALIGFERERVESAAGLRTHAVVSLGAALFMLVSMYGFDSVVRPPGIVLDPSRVAAQVVSGIGFLGAGVIIFRKEVLRGLTTAASIWLVAAIGMAVGGGMYVAALGAAVFALIILAVLKPLEGALIRGRSRHVVSMTIDPKRISPLELREIIKAANAVTERMDLRLSERESKSTVTAVIRHMAEADLVHLIQRLAKTAGVGEVRSVLRIATEQPAQLQPSDDGTSSEIT